MSWDCPYQTKDGCVRLKKPCQPLQKGCVVEGKASGIDKKPDGENHPCLKKASDQNHKNGFTHSS